MTVGRKLAVSVHVLDDDGAAHCFTAGTVPPDWVVAKAVNPDLWVTDEDQPVAAAAPASPTEPTAPVPLEKPPASGAGSGTDEWIAYARSLGLDIADNASRADVIEAVEEHEFAQQPS